MKAKFGAIVVDGRNKVGGHVFSKNRAGAYMRTKVTPVNPQTSFQSEARNRLTEFSQQWRTLTEDQRAAWNAAVSNWQRTDIFGDLKSPTGLNLFVRLNTELDIVGGSALTTPPLPGEVPAITELSLTTNAGGLVSIGYGPSPVPADTSWKVFGTPPVSPGKNFVKSEYRLFATVGAAGTTPLVADTQYAARFGAPVEGQKIFIGLQPVNELTGQVGQMITVSAIVATAP